MAVEAVISEPCSTDLPENSEFTGNFLIFSALHDLGTSGKPHNYAVSTRLPDQMRGNRTGNNREIAGIRAPSPLHRDGHRSHNPLGLGSSLDGCGVGIALDW